MTSLQARLSCVLEVERKFRGLAMRELSRHGGTPGFRSLRALPVQVIHDTYYDRSSVLSSAGAWVRKRNGAWEAKVRMGGNFTNSKFEEIDDVQEISKVIRCIAGIEGDAADNFGLAVTADFSTTRKTWVADDEFHIALDTMDFDHQVGEVELQQVLYGDNGEVPNEQKKLAMMQNMDDRIAAFMKRYSWAFSPGEPTGKLTAYFERAQ